jgi:hypothetical protein
MPTSRPGLRFQGERLMVAGQENWLQEEQDEHGQKNKWEGMVAGHDLLLLNGSKVQGSSGASWCLGDTCLVARYIIYST